MFNGVSIKEVTEKFKTAGDCFRCIFDKNLLGIFFPEMRGRSITEMAANGIKP